MVGLIDRLRQTGPWPRTPERQRVLPCSAGKREGEARLVEGLVPSQARGLVDTRPRVRTADGRTLPSVTCASEGKHEGEGQ